MAFAKGLTYGEYPVSLNSGISISQSYFNGAIFLAELPVELKELATPSLMIKFIRQKVVLQNL